MKNLFTERRSVNFFDKNKNVSDDLIKEMIDLAAKSPSSFNLQPWSLIILKDREEKLKLQELAMNQEKVSEAPVTMIVLADRTGWVEGDPFVEKLFQENIKAGMMTEDQRGWFRDLRAGLYGKSDASIQAFACKNAGFFAMSLMLAAKSLGLDTHPMDGFDHDGVKQAFNIPDRYWIPLLLAVGYVDDDKTLMPPKWRKSYDEIVVRFD